MKRIATETKPEAPRTLIVGIHSPYNSIKNFDSYIEEFRNLVHSSGREYQHETQITLRSIDPANFLTKGKLLDIVALCEKEHIEEVIISEPLSVAQQRNLQDLFHCPVVDRTLLILEIFEAGAVSAEGKKQVTLAKFQYDKSRLAGKGIHMSQQGGRIGTKGPGETAKEKATNHLERLMDKLKRDLEALARVRTTQRKQRIGGTLPLLCLVGYTNAGKSTILNALTKSNVLAQNKLFSTLDTTTRELYFDHTKAALMSDTVGFIQQLPHHLIEAFKSTLSELEHADLLLHVIDASDANWEDHCAVVHQVLEELNVKQPMIYVFNKIDKVQNLELFMQKSAPYKPHVFVSATTEQGLTPLVDYLKNFTLEKRNPKS